MTNYFNYTPAAKRYKQGRPNIHPLVVERVKAKLALKAKLKNTLDVGCGTGLSTLALLEISEQVIGVDTSAAMLGEAQVQPGIQYQQLAAEEIDTLGVTFDLVMMSSVFHWLDQQVFLKACNKVLRAESYIVIHHRMDARAIFDKIHHTTAPQLPIKRGRNQGFGICTDG